MSSKFDVMKKLVQTYHGLASEPQLVEGRILKNTSGYSNNLQISARWTQRDLQRNELRTIENWYLVTKDAKVVQNLSATDVTSELYSRYSPSENRKCVVRVVPDGGKKKQFLEIWQYGRLFQNVDLSAQDLHGDIYPPGDLGSVEWSPNEEMVIFIAEKKRIKAEPFFSSKPQTRPGEDEAFPYGEEYTLIEDWGEQMTDLSQSVIVLYSVKNGLSVLDIIPEGWCPGQLLWDETKSTGFYGIAYKTAPRLGMIYCTNRESQIFHYSLEGDLGISLQDTTLSVRSLRLSPDGKSLIWLQRPAQGPHDACHALMKQDTTTKEVKTLIPIVETTLPENPKINGLYMELPPRCFSKDGTLFFTSVKQNRTEIYSLNLENGEILLRLTAAKVFDVWDDLVLTAYSWWDYFPRLSLYNSSFDGFTDITESTYVSIMRYYLEVVTFPVSGTDFDDFNIILLKPSPELVNLPLIVFPHGGPHSVDLPMTKLEPTFFVTVGFAVLMVNYRGSTGFGEKCVESLLGKIGSLDVGDVQHAVEYVLSKHPDINGQHIAIYGGSHGGFLALQLAGQYPSVYKSVIVRNPVVDLATMFATSDIPDWVSTEIGSKYSPENVPTALENLQMAQMSPTYWIQAYQAPTLFLLGKNDRRVPLAQSLYYNRLLKARGIKTKVHVYPDNHALGTVPVHMDALINATFWINESLGINAQ